MMVSLTTSLLVGEVEVPVTVTVEDDVRFPVKPLMEAVMTAVPELTAVTIPVVETLATSAEDDDQDTSSVRLEVDEAPVPWL
jgi:hypothetical protein